jgi:hypothetical protein
MLNYIYNSKTKIDNPTILSFMIQLNKKNEKRKLPERRIFYKKRTKRPNCSLDWFF